MEDSIRESRVPTRRSPSSRESWERSVNPLSWVRNVSQYLMRKVPSIILFLFSIVMVFGIGEFKNEAISHRLVYVLDLRTFSTLFIKSCGLNGLVM